MGLIELTDAQNRWLEFDDSRLPLGQAIGTCSTQMTAYQRMHIFGTEGHIEIEIPFNALNEKRCRVFVNEELIDFPFAISTRFRAICFRRRFVTIRRS
jgi:hypothetical protein